jgi:hypothetical protein
MFEKLFRRKRKESDLTAEIDAHIQLEIEHLRPMFCFFVGAGFSPALSATGGGHV